MIVSTAGGAFAVAPAGLGTAPKLENYGKLPLSFEANQGQTDAQVRFLSRGSGYSLFLTPTEAVLELKKSIPASRAAAAMGLASAAADFKLPATVLRMKLVGGNASAEIAGADELAGKSNYFIGNELKKWVTGVRTYGSVRYRNVYPGVDLIYYGNQRQLEHDFVVAPGADPAVIALDLVGATRISLSPGGDVVMETPDGEVRLRQPKIYQTISGEQRTVGGRYVRMGETRVGFEISAYDRSLPLVIDPVLNYSTYLGGSGSDQANAIAVDTAGNAYVTGVTGSTNFPTANAAFATNRGGNDAFVVKINAAGSAVVYSTYLGGSGDDTGYGIAVDSAGNAYITGTTTSTNFPTANALFAKFGGGFDDAFVAKINAAGSALVYSTYLGGNSDDGGFGIAVNSKGDAFITGSTGSTNFPTAHALYAKLGGADDAFVAELNATGSVLIYSTYLGGSNGDGGMAIALDSAGFAYVTGETFSANFPTANALYRNFGGGFADAFVAKINSAGSALVYSTFLGGNDFDLGQGIAVDAEGNAYVTGETFSANFPTAHALYPTYRGEGNVFITKLNTAGSALLYSTYMGGTGGDGGRGIAVDGAGNAYVVGSTASVNFPTANAFYGTPGGSEDAFVAKINAGGGSLAYSTYLGGSGDDFGQGIAVDTAGNAYVTGYTLSTNFPTLNALHRSNSGGDDLFVAKIFDSNAGSADVSLSSAAPSFVSPNANITYTIALSNAGPNLGNSVTLKDALPAQTTFVSCSASGGGSCTNSGNNITVNFPSLAKGAKATVTLVARVGSTVPMGSIISNTATVALKTFDPVIANNSSTVTSTISAPAGAAQQFVGPVNVIFKNSTLPATAFNGILGVADFNNDGREDILGIYYANNGTSQCAVLLSNSDGSYTPKLTGIYLGMGSGDTVEVADVDSDGRADIIVVTAPRADSHGDPLGPSILRVYPGNGDGSFRVVPAVNVSNQFASLALVADLNKDGKPDLVISEHPGDFTTISFRVWTNQGAGKFKDAYSVGSSTSIAVLAEGDFTGDGYPDIVMQVSAGIQIFLNNKGTSFTAGATYPIFATVAATGDLNHDGRQDLVAVESAGQQGHILLGKGDGTFRTGATFSISSNPVGPAAEASPASVQITDLNGDSLPDIAVVTYLLSDGSGGSNLHVFPGDGTGNVGFPSVFNIGGALQTRFVDLNRDGKPELLLSGVGLNGGPVRGYSIAANTGSGFFNAPRETLLFGPNSIVTADFNKDGNGDIAVVSDAIASGTNGTVVVYTGSGQGFFNAGRSYAIGMPSGVLTVGDVNGDGKLDLVVARSAAYLANNASGVAARAAAAVRALDSAFDPPGRTAVEQQRWQAERYIAAVHAMPQVEAAASPDASSNTTDVSVLLGVGDGTFKPAINFTVLGAPGAGDRDNFATLADVNHDGKLDLIGDWGVALGRGDGSFSTPIHLASSLKNIVQMTSGDFNGGGGLDLAVATATFPPSVGAVYALFGNGKGSFFVSAPEQLANTDNVYGLAIADMNGDGKGDLIFDASQSVNKRPTSRNLTVRLLNGSVTFGSPINYPLNLSSFIPPLFEFSSPLLTGDFNRDGKIDVLYLGDVAAPGVTPGGRLTLLPGLGDGRLSVTPQYFSTQLQQGVVLDLTRDGAPDVAGITAIGITRFVNSGSKAAVTK